MKRTGGRMGRLANGNRIGIVSFAGTASIDVPLTEDMEVLKQAVDALQAQGIPTTPMRSLRQEHCSALPCAKSAGHFHRRRDDCRAGPAPIAAALRDDDVEIYCIGLVGPHRPERGNTAQLGPANLWTNTSLPPQMKRNWACIPRSGRYHRRAGRDEYSH